MMRQQRKNAELIDYRYIINNQNLQLPYWQRVMPSPLSKKRVKNTPPPYSQSIEITIYLKFDEHANPHYIPECTKPIHVPSTQLCEMGVFEERLRRSSYKWTTQEPFSKHSYRDQSRYAPSQWETSLQRNDVSHWLGAYLEWSQRSIL